MRLALAPLLLALAACVAPSQADPQRYGTVRVAFGDALDDAGPWRADQLAELRGELADLAALGPAFVEASEGAADVVVRTFDSGPGCAAGVGRFHPGSAYVECDPACARGFDELRACAGHELGHFLGLRHVCNHGESNPTCDLAVGTGDALMNPSIAYDVQDAPGDPAAGLTVATPVPTDLDLAEYRAVHP